MRHIAKIFMNGRSQAVRLPAAFRFDAKEVYVRRTKTGDVILSPRKQLADWEKFFRSLDASRRKYPEQFADFMIDRDDPPLPPRDIF